MKINCTLFGNPYLNSPTCPFSKVPPFVWLSSYFFQIKVASFLTMEGQNGEMGIGWPLGLGSMHMRLRLIDNINMNMPLPLPVAAPEPRSLFFHSTSFSSFTSSTLDTESTISFFQDKSKTLGRLIGIRPRNQRSEPYLRNSVNQLEELEMLSSRNYLEHQNEHNNHDMKMCDGFCIPLICLVAKISGNKDGSKR